MEFKIQKTSIGGLLLVTPEVRADARGTASENYKYSALLKAGIRDRFVQENISVNKRGVLRGLHYQRAPRAQARLVRCPRGRVYAVAVDLRRTSATRGRAFGAELSAVNGLQLYAPGGFAHGFCALTDMAEVAYKCSSEYAPELTGGLRWDDQILKIKWPLRRPQVSDRDLAWPPFEPRPERRLR